MTTISNATNKRRAAVPLASALREASPRPKAIAQARALLASGHGAALFEALFALYVSEHDEGLAVAVGELMQTLEKLWSTSSEVAGYLMARLYPIASRAKDHDTYDSIELWMASASDVALADALSHLAREALRPKLRLRYAAWAAHMKQRAEA